MTKTEIPFKEVKRKLEQIKHITILSHLNPDADTLGTALGIYTLLKKNTAKNVEIVNGSKDLPIYLDFLPYFSKIKQKIEYKDSLIITCDCGSIDRFGFNLEGREIINIDHHHSNTMYGSLNIVIPTYASASQVAYALFDKLYDIDVDAATCFYAALLSDTRYFTTNSVNEEVFAVAKALVAKGVQTDNVAYHFTQRKSLASIRILEKALSSLTLYENAKIAVLYVTQEDIKITGAKVPDMEGIVDYARALVTVKIAIFAMEMSEGIRISLRSKEADVSKVASLFEGGGHKVASGFTLTQCSLQESIDKILTSINEIGLLNET